MMFEFGGEGFEGLVLEGVLEGVEDGGGLLFGEVVVVLGEVFDEAGGEVKIFGVFEVSMGFGFREFVFRQVVDINRAQRVLFLVLGRGLFHLSLHLLTDLFLVHVVVSVVAEDFVSGVVEGGEGMVGLPAFGRVERELVGVGFLYLLEEEIG